jgi:uncharacterized protein
MILACMTTSTNAAPPEVTGLSAVPFTEVQIQDEFWAPRLETNRENSLPHNIEWCEETGRIRNFDRAASLLDDEFEGQYYNDSDLYKVLEGASYSLAYHPDPELEQQLDAIIARIAAAQEEDGYLHTFHTVKLPEEKWTDMTNRHELYCAGHLLEAGIAHHRATGKRTLLDVAVRFVNYIDRMFGPEQRLAVPGHQEIELALIKLYQLTGEERYFDLANFFINQRGDPNRGPLMGPHFQDHLPIREQSEITGHAVRAMYFYSAAADVASYVDPDAPTIDPATGRPPRPNPDSVVGTEGLKNAMDRLWRNVALRKMYVTGGIGVQTHGEGFSDEYVLPNDNAYCETCASIGMALWNHRLNLLHGDAKYADMLERVMYNGVLSGVGLDGESFFYVNPMSSDGAHHRSPFFGCACCPTNVVRFIPSMPGYVYATDDNGIYVNLFVAGEADVAFANTSVHVTTETDYPWDGRVKFTLEPEQERSFTVKLRIPEWCQNASLSVNGEPQERLTIRNGYAQTHQHWQSGDVIELNLPMEVQRVEAHPSVEACVGRVAIQRGPIVYCFEAVDNTEDVTNITLGKDPQFKTEHRDDLLGGVTVIKGIDLSGREITAVPYNVWDHREAGEMTVWIQQDGKSTTPRVDIGWEGRLYRTFDPMISTAYDPEDADVVQVRDELITAMGTDKIVFIRRYPLTPNHYYTEHINSEFKPGGGICILDMNDGSVKEYDMGKPGVVNRFDVSYDATKIVFDFKDDHMEGYRIYELEIATGEVTQLTFPPENEDELQSLYKIRTLWDANWAEYHHGESNDYHHGTDDMHPCYLPDGGIAFVSTRCQISTICDGPDIFTSTNMYRMDGDGRNIHRLSRDMVSTFCPVVMPSGQILYHRWEYVDKGDTVTKCLWAMYPDGSRSREIYGNDIKVPHTIIQGRPIPGTSDKYVALGAFHMDNAIGAVMTIDTSQNIRTDAGQRNVTPECPWPVWGIDDAFAKPVYPGRGWDAFYRDPYPLSEKLFMVAYKPQGTHWTDEHVWGLYLLRDNGEKLLIHKEDTTSCWQPVPLIARELPPVPISSVNLALAAEDKAQCMVSNVYHGLENTEPGSIKYLRIMEQVPRPWAARRQGDAHAATYDTFGQQHATVSYRTHLWVAAQWGIATVEEDGSANFTVPANRAIYFQALDAEYRMIQSERTYVNYMPGETASCIGCHETPDEVVSVPTAPLAFQRAPEDPCEIPQPGDESGQVVLSYPDTVQPVWDKHCISCHNAGDNAGDLNLEGTLTTHFNMSYDSLVTYSKRHTDRNVLGFLVDELGSDIVYREAHTLFGNKSVLLKILGLDVWNLTPTQMERAETLTASCSPNLNATEKAQVARWVDTNCQYYGSYWGRRNLQFEDHPNFRIDVTFEEAVSDSNPTPEEKR